MDKLKPIIRHKPNKGGQETASGNYTLDVYNAILQQEAENAAMDAKNAASRKTQTYHSDKKGKCVPELACKCGIYHDAVNHPADKVVAHDMVNHDMVNHPSHYCQGGIECIDAIEAAVTGLRGMEAVCAGNAIKYIWRYNQKNGVEDLKKARFYLNKLILLTERKNECEQVDSADRKEG